MGIRRAGIAVAEEAIERLVVLMRSAEAEHVRLGAIKEILDRALGKAGSRNDVGCDQIQDQIDRLDGCLPENGHPALTRDSKID